MIITPELCRVPNRAREAFLEVTKGRERIDSHVMNGNALIAISWHQMIQIDGFTRLKNLPAAMHKLYRQSPHLMDLI